MTRHDLRELAALTALGVVLGLIPLALRPGRPVFAEVAAQCSADADAGVDAEPATALESAPQSSMIDGGGP